MLGTLVKASRILVYDLPLPYEECLSWIYCPEITPGSSCKKFLKKRLQESKNAHSLLTQELHLKCPSPPVLTDLPDILFWHTFSQIFLYKLFLRSSSSAGILTWENFYSSFLLCSPPETLDKLNLSFPFSYACSEMFRFFTLKSILLIYSWHSPDCVSNTAPFLCTSRDFILDFAAMAALPLLFFI